MDWFVIVTTAPRREPTLQVCIDSLRDCGWGDPVVLAEPDSPACDARTIQNPERLGVWRNWVKSVKIALESDCDTILTVQDDTEFHPDSKAYAEKCMWPASDCGFLSLYTPKHYSLHSNRNLAKLRKKNPDAPNVRPVGVNRIRTQSLWGACALVWSRQVLERVIEHPLIESWAGAAPKSKDPKVYQSRLANPHVIANSDTAIGKIMNRCGYSMWFVDPSPVAHIARFSAIGHGGNDGRRNAYRIADHSIPLEYQAPIPQTVYQI